MYTSFLLFFCVHDTSRFSTSYSRTRKYGV
nr:MAG TPA: hypothetical protein [Caudoviricetes sp.]